MNHFVVYLKLTQHCKSAVPQYKVKIKFKKVSGSFYFFWLYYMACGILAS